MSSSLAAGMAKGIATRTLQRVKGEFTSQNNQGINWQDFNYPPCLHIIHFRLSELKKPVKTVILLLYISFLCVPAISILNCTPSSHSSSQHHHPGRHLRQRHQHALHNPE